MHRGKTALKLAVVGLLLVGLVGGVAGEESYSVVDKEGDGTTDSSVNTLFGLFNDQKAKSEVLVGYQNSINLKVDEITTDLKVFQGTIDGTSDLVVDVYINENGINQNTGEGTLVKDNWQPSLTDGKQSFQLDTSYTFKDGNTYIVEFVTRSITCNDSYCQFALRYDDSASTTRIWTNQYTAQGYGDLIFTGVNANDPPQVNSTSVSPDPPLIGEKVSYGAEASDSDGTVQSMELTVFDDGSQVYQDSQSFSSSSVNYTWSDVVEASEGSLDARFTVTDDAGASTTEWLNRTLTDDAPNISIGSPENKVYGSDNIDYSFNVSSQDSSPDESIDVDVLLDGSNVRSLTVEEGSTVSGTLNELGDGSHTFKVEASEDGGTDTSSINFEVDTTAPEINVTEPEGPTDSLKDLPLNFTADDPHLDSGSCKYSKDGGTNISISSCSNTTIDFGNVGNHTVTVYASDTLGNTGSGLRKFFVDNRNEIFLEDSVSGSSISDFQVTITNGDKSIGGSTSDGRFEFYTSEVPKGDIEVTVKASGYQTRTFTYSSVDDSFTLNTTYRMERAGLTLDAFSEVGSNQIQFNFSASNSTTSFSKNDVDIFQKNYTELQDLGFPTGDVTITVNKDGYKARKYFVTLNENTKSVLDAYLLETGEGIYMTVKITGSNEALNGALASIQRQYGTNYKTVTQSYTKSDGTASFYLSPDISYRIQVTHPDYKVFTGTFSPVNYQYEPLEIRLSEDSNFTESTVWSEISYKLTPQFQTLNRSDAYTFNWSVSDSSGSLSSLGLELLYENSTLNETSVSGSPSGSSVSLDLNLSKYNVSFGDDLVVKGSFVRNEQLFIYKKRYSVISPVTQGVSSFSALLGSAEGLSSVAKGFVALIFSILSMIAVSETNVINKGAGAVGLAVLGLFVLEQWFPTFPFYASLIAYVGVIMYR